MPCSATVVLQPVGFVDAIIRRRRFGIDGAAGAACAGGGRRGGVRGGDRVHRRRREPAGGGATRAGCVVVLARQGPVLLLLVRRHRAPGRGTASVLWGRWPDGAARTGECQTVPPVPVRTRLVLGLWW